MQNNKKKGYSFLILNTLNAFPQKHHYASKFRLIYKLSGESIAGVFKLGARGPQGAQERGSVEKITEKQCETKYD